MSHKLLKDDRWLDNLFGEDSSKSNDAPSIYSGMIQNILTKGYVEYRR